MIKRAAATTFASAALTVSVLAACVRADTLQYEIKTLTTKADLCVGRISFIEGSVQTTQGEDTGWEPASLNMPLLSRDRLVTGDGGRTEVQLEDDVVLRFGSDTHVELQHLGADLVRITLTEGDMIVQAPSVPYARPDLVVRLPAFSVRIDRVAKLRVRAEEHGWSNVEVREGQADVEFDDGRKHWLGAGQGVESQGRYNDHWRSVSASGNDEFDLWSDRRDAVARAAVSRTHLSPYISRYDDLARHGDWVEVPEYGRVWRPRVTVASWAPYRAGRWLWRDACGWVWVSSEPWGWLPYHYGRWVWHTDYRWCWVPVDVVRVVRRPVWSPAWVA